MEETRISTIINEIEYWKKHKILPAQQCDFLLALYTHGDNKELVNSAREKQAFIRSASIIKMLQLTLLLMLLPFSFLVLYFTEFHSYFQIAILILFLLYTTWSFINVKQRGNSIYHVSLLVSLFLLLLVTISVGSLFIGDSGFISLIIGLNFLLWCILSIFFKLNYLLITSIIGVLFIIFYTFS